MTEITREDVIELDSQAAKELKSIDRVAGGNTAGFIGKRLEWLTKIRAVCTLALEALNQREQGEWIKTSDRLPEKPGKKSYEYVDCLIYINGNVQQQPWNCEHLCWDDTHYDDFQYEPTKPTHWMPLPTPPAKEPSDDA